MTKSPCQSGSSGAVQPSTTFTISYCPYSRKLKHHCRPLQLLASPSILHSIRPHFEELTAELQCTEVTCHPSLFDPYVMRQSVLRAFQDFRRSIVVTLRYPSHLLSGPSSQSALIFRPTLTYPEMPANCTASGLSGFLPIFRRHLFPVGSEHYNVR